MLTQQEHQVLDPIDSGRDEIVAYLRTLIGFKTVTPPNGGRVDADCGYEVVAIPCVSDAYRTLPDGTPSTRGLYANSLMMNGRVLVCQYGRDLAKYDELALAIYHRELSDYQVIPIECTLIANGGGGINCTTHEIPAISAA